MFTSLRAYLAMPLALAAALPLIISAPASAAPVATATTSAASSTSAQSTSAVVTRKRNPRGEVSRSVSRSLVGVRPSAYIGKFYDSKYERVRKCIVRRESEGHYRVVNRSSGAAGAYQFMRGTGRVAAIRMGRRDLAGTSANRWSRFEQDKAFWVMWNHGRGAGHWGGGRFHC